MTDSTERGSSLARMTPAEAMATSVPAPIAMPTSACASAGASLTPSPTIATLRPSACSSLTFAALSSGRTPAKNRSMPSSAATDAATGFGVAGDHHDLRRRARAARRRPAAIRGGSRRRASGAGHAPVDEHVQDDRALAAPRLGDRQLGAGLLASRSRAADAAPAAVDGARSPRPRATTRSPTRAGTRRTAVLAAAATIARASGCSESRLGGGRQREHARRRCARPSRRRR